MIELQVIGGCRQNGPCEQGSLSGEGFHVVTEVNVKDQSVYDQTAFSPQLIDKATGLPFMESIMTRFPTMDFTCPFCNAPTKVNGVTNMNGVAIETETARKMTDGQVQESKETMGESQPWDEPAVEESSSVTEALNEIEDNRSPFDNILEEEEAPEAEDHPDEIDLSEEEPMEEDSMPLEDDPIDPDDPIIL